MNSQKPCGNSEFKSSQLHGIGELATELPARSRKRTNGNAILKGGMSISTLSRHLIHVISVISIYDQIRISSSTTIWWSCSRILVLHFALVLWFPSEPLARMLSHTVFDISIKHSCLVIGAVVKKHHFVEIIFRVIPCHPIPYCQRGLFTAQWTLIPSKKLRPTKTSLAKLAKLLPNFARKAVANWTFEHPMLQTLCYNRYMFISFSDSFIPHSAWYKLCPWMSLFKLLAQKRCEPRVM